MNSKKEKIQVQSIKKYPKKVNFSQQNSTTNYQINTESINRIPSILGENDLLPSHLFYEEKGVNRPSIAHLKQNEKPLEQNSQIPSNDERINHNIGMGAGVIARSILSLIGVIYFLRLGFIVGYAGIGFAILIIILSTLVTIITTLSLSAISSNGRISAGGPYHVISRSLGHAFGGAIGIVISLSFVISVALYAMGLAETMVETLGLRMSSSFYVERLLWGWIFMSVMFLGIINGLSVVIKIQVFLLVILIISILFILSSSFGRNYSKEIFCENWKPSFTHNQDFFSIFSLFFPAVIGILPPSNISGDLKTPQKALPKGLLTAVLITSTLYLLTTLMLGAIVPRSGDLGLKHNYFIFKEISFWKPIAYVGLFAAAYSSSLSSFLSGPNIFQAVCEDRLFPKAINFFGKISGSKKLPYRAIVLSYFLSFLAILLGEINRIASYTTAFFLLAFSLINWACFQASIAHLPSFRPAFKYYNPYLALFGTILSIALIFLINWISALVSLVAVLILYKYLDLRKLDVNWAANRDGRQYLKVLNSLIRFGNVKEHAKTFRPGYLYLSTSTPTSSRNFSLINFFSESLKEGKGMFMFGEILMAQELEEEMNRSKWIEQRNGFIHWAHSHSVKIFYDILIANSFQKGAKNLLLLTGIGNFRPNIVVLDFLENWNQEEEFTNKNNTNEETNTEFITENNLSIIENEKEFNNNLERIDIFNTINNEETNTEFITENNLSIIENEKEFNNQNNTNEKEFITENNLSIDNEKEFNNQNNTNEKEFITENNLSIDNEKEFNDQNNTNEKEFITENNLSIDNEKEFNNQNNTNEETNTEFITENNLSIIENEKEFNNQNNTNEKEFITENNLSIDNEKEFNDDDLQRIDIFDTIFGENEKEFNNHLERIDIFDTIFGENEKEFITENDLSIIENEKEFNNQNNNNNIERININSTISGENETEFITENDLSIIDKSDLENQEIPLENSKLKFIYSGKKWEIPNIFEEPKKKQIPISEYIQIISLSFDLSYGVVITKGIEGIDLEKKYTGNIDIWWLSDDGGLTILIPYLLSKNKNWRKSKLRVFSHTHPEKMGEDEDDTYSQIKNLLEQFRIDAEVIVTKEVFEKPSSKYLQDWENYSVSSGEKQNQTLKLIKLSEVIQKNSRKSDFVVISMPFPDKSMNPKLFMSWLDFLSKGMPPLMFIRGNHKNVLTFQI
ncbi:solute carrier family 12 cation cotransporter [Anaeramoeba ignava]|uniref:Solute carrier family 12 cation cotransporter n=1 Tax=Anaeramoeba ignava TaxID=1746090 RepID=A0A9Q0LS57_ANAIG|nr:solute carrier family 12 cation cotransporter [Anaeramoeba ignava]